MSSDSDIVMGEKVVNIGHNKHNLLEGGEREITSPETEQEITSPKIPNIHPSYQLIIGTDKIKQIEEITDERLAETLGAKKEEIIIDQINGKEVIILSYENKEKLEEAMTRNPLLKTIQCKQSNTSNIKTNEWVKIRQWPTNGDIEHIILLNDLLGWYGKVFPPKNNQKHTTAILKAPSERRQRNYWTEGLS